MDYTLPTIQERENFLWRLINGDIEITDGNIRFLKESKIFDEPCNINNIVTSFGGTFEKITAGGSSKIFEVCLDKNCVNSFILTETIYETMVNYPYVEENVEVSIFKLLNNFVLSKITPHIPLYFGDFVCKIQDKNYRYTMVERAQNNLNDYIKILIERDTVNLDNILRTILFQIIYTLRVIQQKYPNFRHNDLHPENILLYETNQIQGDYIYNVDGSSFAVPNIAIRSAIWDFDFSSITGQIDNIKVLSASAGHVGVWSERNQTTDLFKLLNWLLSEIPFKAVETREFIMKYIPLLYRGRTKYSNIEGSLKIITDFYTPVYDIEFETNPATLLQDPYFDSFKKVSERPVIETYSDQTELLNISIEPMLRHEITFQCDQELPYYEYKNEIPISPYYKSRRECKNSKNYSKIVNIENIKFFNILYSWLEKYYIILIKSNHLTIIESVLQDAKKMVGLIINQLYIPVQFLQLIGLICLNKSMFYHYHIHLFTPVKFPDMTAGAYSALQSFDAQIQINRFLVLTGIEEEIMNGLKIQTLP